MSVPPLPDLILYGRPGCGPCDEARELAVALLEQRRTNGLPTPELVERNIETDPDLERELFALIPVVELGGERLETLTSVVKLRRLLTDVLDTAPTGV